MIQINRAYGPPAKTDGTRILVERLWPRGIKKEALKLDDWLKDAAPSTELRKWFRHDPAKWPEFQRRYRAELNEHPDVHEGERPSASISGRSVSRSAPEVRPPGHSA